MMQPAPPAAVRKGVSGAFYARLRASLPTGREATFGAFVWGVTMALSALVALYWRNGAQTFHFYQILLLYFCGGVASWPFSLFIARFATRGRRYETRFAAFFLCLTVLTIAATTFFFAMQYRQFFTRWHAPFGTRIWMYQFVFTFLGAAYQFVVMGIRLYMPVGFAALAAASLWLARQARDQQR